MKSIAMVGAFAVVLVAGCARSVEPRNDIGARPQRITATVTNEPNEFVGIWSSPPTDTVNDWIVIFTDKGYVAVDGPGMKADGTYQAAGFIAKASYDKRDGKSRINPDLATTEFKLSADGKALVFSTGQVLDPPVKLVRSSSPDVGPARPSLKGRTEVDEPMNPFTFAEISVQAQ